MEDEPLWITREGEELKVSEMTNSHLQNAYNMIVRRHWRSEFEPILKAEIERRRGRAADIFSFPPTPIKIEF